jgi:hypothetical protein
MTPLLETAYWPNLHYFYYVINSDTITIEQHESYHKQSFRNRTQVLTANGKLDLSIPVKKVQEPGTTQQVEISYAENWQIKHWRAITSAYKNSPYFDFFEDEIRFFYDTQINSLLEYNQLQLRLILKILKLKKEILLTTDYQKNAETFIDLRNKIHPKLDFTNDQNVSDLLTMSYYQTFENKFPFHPNLSILDLLFNRGLQSIDYLKQK